jgi:mono/diheme cytochrome c family protein
MPGFSTVLTDDEIWAVIAYIKSRWPQELVERRRPQTAAKE